LQFAFSGEEDNPYLPHNIEPNSVVYTGTHDNDTTVGWHSTMDDQQRTHVHRQLGVEEPQDLDVSNQLIKMALESKANLAVIPMQDILGLDTDHRMNTPGTATGNWHWRFNWQLLPKKQKDFFSNAIKRTGRH
jgi:4-alpha-glucanotransferase